MSPRALWGMCLYEADRRVQGDQQSLSGNSPFTTGIRWAELEYRDFRETAHLGVAIAGQIASKRDALLEAIDTRGPP